MLLKVFRQMIYYKIGLYIKNCVDLKQFSKNGLQERFYMLHYKIHRI